MDGMHITACDLFPATGDWLFDLANKSVALANLVNNFVNVRYDILEPELRDWDRQHGDKNLPDPLENAMKLQKFGMQTANGMLFSAAYAATNSLTEEGPSFTPLATGSLCRSSVEMNSYSLALLRETEPREKTACTYRIFSRGINEYHWGKTKMEGRQELFRMFSDWAQKQGISNKPKFQPSALINPLIPFVEDAYSFLSDFTHGNPVLIAMSILDAQEDFGFNRQYDYWALATAFTMSLRTFQAFTDSYRHVCPDKTLHKIKEFDAYTSTFSQLAAVPWGTPKAIPDRQNPPL